MRRGLLAIFLLGAVTTITPEGELRTQDGARLGTARPNAWGGYDIYGTAGERRGSARPNPWGGYDLYNKSGGRGLEPSGGGKSGRSGGGGRK
jgi:hypothetical protein